MRRGREHALQAAQVQVEAIGMPTVCTDKITARRQTDRYRRQVRKRDVADMVFLFWVQRVVFLIVAVRMGWSSACRLGGGRWRKGSRDGGERLVLVVVVRRCGWCGGVLAHHLWCVVLACRRDSLVLWWIVWFDPRAVVFGLSLLMAVVGCCIVCTMRLLIAKCCDGGIILSILRLLSFRDP